MNTDEFWNIIDSVHTLSGGDMNKKCKLLRERLNALKPDEFTDYIARFDEAELAAYTWPLWGAVFVWKGGCSDDAFSDFRATLISHGRSVYEAVLVNPESLSEVLYTNEVDACYEGFQYVHYNLAKEKLGAIPESKTCWPDEPSGEEWDEETVDDLYPILAAKFKLSQLPSKPWWRFF
ncbi:MAG: DUF4240 domain-containing protein [Akkermansiaceae bacterium]|nr:DUF4240 domain-containing protein [Akkermansiaceae bacterium]